MFSKSHMKSYLTPNEVAELLMVVPATVRVWADKGLLRAKTTAGGHRRFLLEDVERFRRELGDGAGAAPRKAPRILVVDDDSALLRYFSAWLGGSECGATVATAADGFAAGQMLHSFAPDVVLLDLCMPGLDGFQVCRQIKQTPATAAVRIIAMSGQATADNAERIALAGAEACLEKPVDEARLLALLGMNDGFAYKEAGDGI